MNRLIQYRFTKRDGTFRYEFVERGNIAQLQGLMRVHAATKAEPVEPPPCPTCAGPVCPIIEPEESQA